MKLREMAKHLGVAASTASRALNPAKAHLVAEPLRKTIQDYAKKIHYTPNTLAQNLAKGRSQTIGVIIYSAFGSLFFDDYLPKVQAGIYAALKNSPSFGCKIVLLPRGGSLTEIDQHVAGSGVDGILISTICDFTAGRLRNLASVVERRWRRPVVALNIDPLPRSRISTVSFNNEEAGYQAAVHLIRRRHRRVGLIYIDDGSPDIASRLKGFHRGFADHGLSIHVASKVEGDPTEDRSYQSTIEIFKHPENAVISAIFCANDQMAFGCIQALRTLGKDCPKDVAVMGFDGLTIGAFSFPTLTSVEQPSYEIARTGMALLLDLVEGRKKPPVHLTVPSKLILRDSA